MKPYYEHDGIVIYHGDCLEVLPSVVADCFVTDPPYGINGGRGGQVSTRNKVYSGTWEDTPDYVETVCVYAVTEMVRRGYRGALTPGLRCAWKYPAPASMGCFWQPATVAYEPWGLSTFQPILYYGRDARAGKGQSPTGWQVTERASADGHPCAKPLQAWARLVNKVAGSSTTVVLDPFVGAGTTLVVAKRQGHKAIGIEIDERYCEIAAKRLQQEVLPLEMA